MLWQKNKDLALRQKRQKTGKRKSLLSKFYFNFCLMIILPATRWVLWWWSISMELLIPHLLDPIHSSKLYHLKLHYGLLIGQSNKSSTFNWLKLNLVWKKRNLTRSA